MKLKAKMTRDQIEEELWELLVFERQYTIDSFRSSRNWPKSQRSRDEKFIELLDKLDKAINANDR